MVQIRILSAHFLLQLVKETALPWGGFGQIAASFSGAAVATLRIVLLLDWAGESALLNQLHSLFALG